MITDEAIQIYIHYEGNEDLFGRCGSQEHKDMVPWNDWCEIRSLVQDIIVVKKNLTTKAYAEEVRRKIQQYGLSLEIVELLYNKFKNGFKNPWKTTMKKHKIFTHKNIFIVLTVLMLIGAILVAFDYARKTGRNIPNSFSYSMGTLIFACILIAIFSAIKSARKNLVYIAFCISLLCFVLILNRNVQKSNELESSSLQQQYMKNRKDVNGTPFYSKQYGFMCLMPEGFLPARSSKKSEIAMYVYPNYENYEKMMIIEVGRPILSDSISFAEDLAEDWSGEVLTNHVNLDGIDALRIKARKETGELRPTDAIVAMKDGNAFLIMAGLSSGQSCEAEINTVLDSWQWTDEE